MNIFLGWKKSKKNFFYFRGPQFMKKMFDSSVLQNAKYTKYIMFLKRIFSVQFIPETLFIRHVISWERSFLTELPFN